MKRICTLAILLLVVGIVKAQNVQLHYDFGSAVYNKDLKSRPVLTSTVEMFKPDKWGSTYFFIDMDYTSKGITSGYWEIARELRFWEPPISLHLEYNGGVSNTNSYNNAYLGGLTYTYNNKSFSKGFTVSGMYKYIQKLDHPNSFQLTGTWYINFAKNGLFTFSGFADWWLEKNPHGNFIFISEPQLWFNLNKIKGVDEMFKLSIGVEVELSNNFSYRNGFYAIPTIAAKWSFN